MSSAIASELAKGNNMKSAVQVAKEYIAGAVANADKLNIGTGSAPSIIFIRSGKIVK